MCLITCNSVNNLPAGLIQLDRDVGYKSRINLHLFPLTQTCNGKTPCISNGLVWRKEIKQTLDALRLSDVDERGARAANPAAAPQPVVGIHFEVIIGGTDNNPPLRFHIPSASRVSIQAAERAPARTRAHTHVRTHTKGYNVTGFGQVCAAAASGAEKQQKKGGEKLAA